mgnify:CR=1 FL=1|tara:strand:- start:160 stop:348 length:189 start_codon:yes stop_codon:yes gene_type:complete
MAATQVTADVIKDGTITATQIANTTITSGKVDSSVAKVVTLTQAAYDALGSYNSSTLYITTE